MIWIPIIFLCAEACMFLQGTAEYSPTKCYQTLKKAVDEIENRPGVRVFDAVCMQIKLA